MLIVNMRLSVCKLCMLSAYKIQCLQTKCMLIVNISVATWLKTLLGYLVNRAGNYEQSDTGTHLLFAQLEIDLIVNKCIKWQSHSFASLVARAWPLFKVYLLQEMLQTMRLSLKPCCHLGLKKKIDGIVEMRMRLTQCLQTKAWWKRPVVRSSPRQHVFWYEWAFPEI